MRTAPACGPPSYTDGPTVHCPCGWHQAVTSKRRGKRRWNEHRWWAMHGTVPPWRPSAQQTCDRRTDVIGVGESQRAVPHVHSPSCP